MSVAYGFAYADVPDIGATVMVITNNDQKLADRIADDMSDFIWKKREEFAGKTLPKTEEGVRLAIAAAKAGKVPVVVADHSDRTGNSTWILAELIRQGGKNFCITTLTDERALAELRGKPAGDAVSREHGRLGRADIGQAREDRRHARVDRQVRADGTGGGHPVRRQQPRHPDAGPPPGDRSRTSSSRSASTSRSSTSSC